MKKETFAVFIAAGLLLTASQATALEEEIHVGRQDRWADIIEKENVIVSDGYKGFQDISLDDGAYSITGDTDLLIHFDRGISDETANYRAAGTGTEVTERISRFGEGGGLFSGNRQGLLLTPRSGSLFAPNTLWGDFTIEFWLYPATVEEGETILLWQGTRSGDGGPIGQEIVCEFKDRRLSWEFDNVFITSGSGDPYTVVVTGLSPMVPRRWHHHMLRFDSSIGLLEYLVDGVTEAVTHASASGSEDGTVYLPYIGGAGISELLIGARYTGVIDEFRISRGYVSEPFVLRYPLQTGSVTTRVYDLEYSNTRLLAIEAEYLTPGDTDVEFYYRLDDSKSSSQAVDAEWIPFEPGTVFNERTRGRYLQILIELYPDGSGLVSPVVREITIRYEPDTPPLPPARVTAVAGNRKITLTWSSVADADIAGYLVYYGYRPGIYFGTDSSTGDSPLDAGNVTSFVLDGLEDGRLYYFSVVSYDSSTPPHRSVFSKEVSTRPSRILGKE